MPTLFQHGREVRPAKGQFYFINAWDQRTLEKLVDDCFHGRPCHDPRRRARG